YVRMPRSYHDRVQMLRDQRPSGDIGRRVSRARPLTDPRSDAARGTADRLTGYANMGRGHGVDGPEAKRYCGAVTTETAIVGGLVATDTGAFPATVAIAGGRV